MLLGEEGVAKFLSDPALLFLSPPEILVRLALIAAARSAIVRVLREFDIKLLTLPPASNL